MNGPRTAAGRLAVLADDYAWIIGAQLRAAARPPEAAGWSSGDRVPVLLLPGVYETWAVLADLGRALHGAGHPVHPVPGLGHNAGALAASAALVGAELDRLGLDRVVLVGHSKGGLIGKLVLADPTSGRRAVGLVAINTPFGGSVLARLFPTRAVRSLAPDHPQIRALAADAMVHGRIVSLYAPFDPHVPEGSVLPGAHNEPLPLDGHFRPLGDERVHRQVIDSVARVDAMG